MGRPRLGALSVAFTCGLVAVCMVTSFVRRRSSSFADRTARAAETGPAVSSSPRHDGVRGSGNSRTAKNHRLRNNARSSGAFTLGMARA